MEKFTDIKLKSYSIKKEYYPEKGYVKCPDCPSPKLLHCSYCVQHLRNQNPHHWVGITVNEVPGCRGCRERYQRGLAEAKNEAIWLRKKLNILEMRMTSHADDLKEAYELADTKLTTQQLAYEGAESVTEMHLRAQLEDLSKPNEGAESIAGMKLGLELENMKELYEDAESRVTFLKRHPPDSAAAVISAGLGSTLPFVGDVTFVVQGQNIYAHQLILGYISCVFRKMFEEVQLQPQKIPDTLEHVETVRTPPRIPPPPPPPPPPLPYPPPPEAPPEKLEDKPRKKRERMIPPIVKVGLVSSPMLEQMGLRGVRCQLSVAAGQALVDDAGSQTPISLLIPDSPEIKCRPKSEKTEVRTTENGQGLQPGKTISEANIVSVPLVSPAEKGVHPQIAAPGDTHPCASGPTMAASSPTLEPQGEKNEDNASGQCKENVALSVNGPPCRTNLIQALQAARPVTTQAIIQVHGTSYAVMRAVIDCCYTADMDFTDEVSPGEVLKVAHKYEIDYLRALCEQYLCDRLNAGNVAEMLKLGRRFGARKLHSQATQFFKENFDDVQESVLNGS